MPWYPNKKKVPLSGRFPRVERQRCLWCSQIFTRKSMKDEHEEICKELGFSATPRAQKLKSL